MTLTEYKSLLWQDKNEAFYEFCEQNELDHTDPYSKEIFFDSLNKETE